MVLVKTQTPITAIAANSTWLGLRRDHRSSRFIPGCVTVINHRRWLTGAITNVFRCNQNGQEEDSGGFALGRSATAWITGLFQSQGFCDLEEAMSLRTPAGGVRDSSFHRVGCGGNELVNLVARGGFAAYTKAIWTTSSCPGNPTTGTDSVTGGDVRTLRLPTGQPQALPGSPPARFVGLSRTRVALVPYDLTTGVVNSYPPAAAGDPGVETRQACATARDRRDGHDSRDGDVRRSDRGARAGRLRGSAHRPVLGVHRRGKRLDARRVGNRRHTCDYYRWTVYVAGNTVKAINARNGSVYTIATSSARPRQVVAVRGRAVWFTTTDSRSRVLAAPLP